MLPFVRRLVGMLPTLMGAITFAFLLIRVAPGDPARLVLGDYEAANPRAVAQVRRQLGLDKPLAGVWTTGHARRGELARRPNLSKPSYRRSSPDRHTCSSRVRLPPPGPALGAYPINRQGRAPSLLDDWPSRVYDGSCFAVVLVRDLLSRVRVRLGVFRFFGVGSPGCAEPRGPPSVRTTGGGSRSAACDVANDTVRAPRCAHQE